MNVEFDEKELNSLIEEALSSSEKDHPFSPKSGLYLGFGETDLLQTLYNNLSTTVNESSLVKAFKDLRTDILSRKASFKITDLHTVVKNCKKCEFQGVVPELPKWNVDNPDVLFVIDSPNIQQESVNFFLKSLKDAEFKSSNVCLTYVNRCPIRNKFSNQEIINCAPYLHTEIQLMNPKLIVTLGSLPASVLFGLELKIKEYRGNINWLGYWPILSTYSPAYAVKAGQLVCDQFLSDIKTAHTFVYKEEKDND